MTHDHDDIATEPDHASSPTDHVLSELQLYGYRPHDGEPDTRGVPEDDHIARAVADIFDAIIATFCDTSLDADLDEVLWSVNQHAILTPYRHPILTPVLRRILV